MARRHHDTVRVCFVGGPGTGKSTLAQAVNVAMKMDGCDCEHVPEYARTYIRRCGAPTHYLEQFPLIIGASRHEEEVEIHDVMIVDSASFIMAVYFIHYASVPEDDGERTKWEYHFNVMQGLGRQRLVWFDHIVYVPHGAFAVPEGDPSRHNADDQDAVSRAIETYLEANGVEYYTVRSSSLSDRVDEVMAYFAEQGVVRSDGR